jgi:hypothetical protein
MDDPIYGALKYGTYSRLRSFLVLPIVSNNSRLERVNSCAEAGGETGNNPGIQRTSHDRDWFRRTASATTHSPETDISACDAETQVISAT